MLRTIKKNWPRHLYDFSDERALRVVAEITVPERLVTTDIVRKICRDLFGEENLHPEAVRAPSDYYPRRVSENMGTPLTEQGRISCGNGYRRFVKGLSH